MYAAFAGQLRVPARTGTLLHSAVDEARTWARWAVSHSLALADAAAIMAGTAVASILYPCCSLPAIGWPAILQMAVSATVVAIGGLRHFGCYPNQEPACPPVEPLKMAVPVLVACLAALGLAFSDASRHAHLWVWAGFWISSCLATLVLVRWFAGTLLALDSTAGGARLTAWLCAAKAAAPKLAPAEGGVPPSLSVYDRIGEAGFALDWWPGFDAALRQLADAGPDQTAPEEG
jgi:hypothetical protein